MNINALAEARKAQTQEQLRLMAALALVQRMLVNHARLAIANPAGERERDTRRCECLWCQDARQLLAKIAS